MTDPMARHEGGVEREPVLLALDWGTSSLRAFRMGGLNEVPLDPPQPFESSGAVRCPLPVRGVTPDGMKPFPEAGAAGFGSGSALHAPGMPMARQAEPAERRVTAWKKLSSE